MGVPSTDTRGGEGFSDMYPKDYDKFKDCFWNSLNSIEE